MKAALRTLCILAVLSAGCATTDTPAPAQTRSTSRVFQYPYERAYAAALAAAKLEHLAVVEADQGSGRMKLASHQTTTGLAETIIVTVTRTDAKSSTVTVLSNAPNPGRDMPPNWGRIIDDRVGEFREAPSDRIQFRGDWGFTLLARIAAELDGVR